MSLELKQASLALQRHITKIQSETEASIIIEIKNEKPEYNNNQVLSIEQSATPTSSTYEFTGDIKERPVSIIKDENTDKFEGMF